ncbi:MAG: ABC transporter permease [Vulcanimicrobiaceae bacterium]
MLVTASTPTSRPRRARGLALRFAQYWLLALLLVVWQLVSSSVPGLQLMLPPPSSVFSAAVELLKSGALLQDIVASLARVFVAVGVAALIGIPLGAAMGGIPAFRWSFDPVLEFIRPIPPLAWIPLAILWFGISEKEIDFIIFLAAFFPIVLNSAAGIRDVDVLVVRAARSLGASPLVVFFTVYVPAAMSQIIVGIRVGMGIGWMALVAGELVGATTGLGFLISQGRMVFRSDYILLGMVTIGLIGLALDGLIRGLSAALMPWKR